MDLSATQSAKNSTLSPKNMGFSALEIAGLALIGIATVMQISAVGTLKWRTAELTVLGTKYSYSYGLFQVCVKAVGEICSPTTSDKQNKGKRNRFKINKNDLCAIYEHCRCDPMSLGGVQDDKFSDNTPYSLGRGP